MLGDTYRAMLGILKRKRGSDLREGSLGVSKGVSAAVVANAPGFA